MSDFVTRFAPSPTGRLHRGHAVSVLTAQAAARAAGGVMLLRIEDIDRDRCRPQLEAGIYEDLAWLGLQWPQPVRRQSDHLADYAAVAAGLAERGLAYRCFKTRKEVLADIGRAPHGPGEGFRGGPLPTAQEAARVAGGEAYAWRLSLDAAEAALGGWGALSFEEEGAGPGGETGLIPVRPEAAGDVVLARKGLGVAYHLAVVVDDAGQEVSHVIRGQDLFEATHIQRVLQALLGLPAPVYRHHRLLLDADGRRYAKRDRAQTLAEIRASGVSAAALRAELGFSPP